jgi:hypothetical protein
MLDNHPHDHLKCGGAVYNSESGKHYCHDCAFKFRVGDAGRMRKSIEEIAKRVNTKVWKKKHSKRGELCC